MLGFKDLGGRMLFWLHTCADFCFYQLQKALSISVIVILQNLFLIWIKSDWIIKIWILISIKIVVDNLWFQQFGE